MSVNSFVMADIRLTVKWLVEEDDYYKTHTTLQSWNI